MLDVSIPVMLAEGEPNTPAAPLFGSPIFLILMMGLVFYFVMWRPQSRERKQRLEMLSAIKKNDRVVTIGGIVGTVVQIKDDEVTLKVDESNNTKISFLRSAIQRVLMPSPSGAVEASGEADKR